MTPPAVRILFVLSVSLAAALGFAAHALTLPEALQSVPERSSVVNAVAELRDARTNLDRVTRDPLAVRADTLQAEQRLALAESSLEQTRYTAQRELTTAYTGVLQANAQVALAEQSLALSERARRVATIRLENGSATQLDLSDAEASLNETQNGLRAAREGQGIALSNLVSILGTEVEADELEPLPEGFLTDLPPLEVALTSAERHPDLLTVAQQTELADLGASVLDPLYAPQSQIDTAASQLASAESGLREAERGFRLQVRNLYAAAENARETLRLETEARANAAVRLRTQQQRFDGGLISQIDFDQAGLADAQAALEAENARVAYLTALLELQAGSLVPLGGPLNAALGRPE